MDSLNKPISTTSSLNKTSDPLLKPSGTLGMKEPLLKQGLTSTSTSDQLLAGQSSAAGSQGLPATGFVTYVESSLEPIITITESPVATAPLISTALNSEQRLKGSSPLLSDLERGTIHKPLETKPGYERKLDTKLEQKLEGPSLTRNAGADLLGNTHETSRMNAPAPASYPTTVGTGTFGMGGAEIPALTSYPGSTTGTTAPSLVGEPAPMHQTSITDKLKEKVHKHDKHEKHEKHVGLKSEHKHKHSGEKVSREEKKNMSNEEKYVLHEQQAAVADVEGHGIKAGIEDLKAGYRKTEAETDVKGEGKLKHKKHKHGHKKDSL